MARAPRNPEYEAYERSFLKRDGIDENAWHDEFFNEFIFWRAGGGLMLNDNAHVLARLRGPFCVVRQCETCGLFSEVAYIGNVTLLRSLAGEEVDCAAIGCEPGQVLCFLGRIDPKTGKVCGAGAMYKERDA